MSAEQVDFDFVVPNNHENLPQAWSIDIVCKLLNAQVIMLVQILLMLSVSLSLSLSLPTSHDMVGLF